jgi:hypothetical protein
MRFWRFLLPMVVLIVIVSILVPEAIGQAPDGSHAGPGAFQVEVGEPVTPTVTRPLGELPLVAPGVAADREVNPRRITQQPLPPPAPMTPERPDPLLGAAARQLSLDPGFQIPLLNFNAQGYNNVNPPDPVGDVGPNHYVHLINSPSGTSVVVYDKAGTVQAGPYALDSLASSGACTNGAGDPIVLYDSLADRWLLSEFSGTGNNLCVYISTTPDPLGTWYAYQFTTPEFPDYPKYAVWPDAYYVSTNEAQSAAYAMDRFKMLAGLPASYQRFSVPGLAAFWFNALIPSDLDGDAPPPLGAPNFFMRHRDDEAHDPDSANPTRDYLEIYQFHVDWATPANSTFTGPIIIPVAEFSSELCGYVSLSCFRQPGPFFTPTLDPIREVIMFRLQYRNFGAYETLVGNFVVDANGADRGGVRWFELRRNLGGAWGLQQEGTVSPDAANRWLGSIAMDGSGNIALGYSVSSSSVYPSLRYVGRLATDAQGTMPQGEVSLVAGTSANDSNRWGDYAAMSVDPVDECTFWFTSLYTTGGHWQTRVGTFKFDACGCTAPAAVDDLEISMLDATSVRLTWSPASGASSYQVWRKADDPYFTPPSDALCIADNGCELITDNEWIDLSLGDPPGSTAYLVRAVSACGGVAAASNRVAEFRYHLEPGTASR